MSRLVPIGWDSDSDSVDSKRPKEESKHVTVPPWISPLVQDIWAAAQSISEDYQVREIHVTYAEYMGALEMMLYLAGDFPDHDRFDTDESDEKGIVRIDRLLPPMDPVWMAPLGRDMVMECVRRWRTASYDAGYIPIAIFSSQTNGRFVCSLKYTCGCGESIFSFAFTKSGATVDKSDQKSKNHTPKNAAGDRKGKSQRPKKHAGDRKGKSQRAKTDLDDALCPVGPTADTGGCLVGPYLEATRRVLPPLDSLQRIGGQHGTDYFVLRDLSALPSAPDDRRDYALEWVFAYNGVTMVFDHIQQGPFRFVPTSGVRYETVWEAEKKVIEFPAVAALFWDWETNQYLRLMAVSEPSTRVSFTNVDLGGGHGGWSNTKSLKCILESIAINPLTPAVIWRDRAQKHTTFAHAVHLAHLPLLFPICLIIASFDF